MINVFHIVSSKTWGGAERYASDLVEHMKHDPLKGIRDIDSPVRLARMLRKGKNIVHVHTYRDAMTAVMARIISDNPNTKVVFTPHTLKRPTMNYVSKKVYRNIDQYVFVSQFAHDHFIAHAPRIKKSQSLVIPESVLNTDTSAQAPVPDLHKQLNMEPHQALIMFHGRINRDKGIDVLLQAVNTLDRDSFKLVILGEGQPKAISRIKSYIIENKLVRNVYLMGFQRNVHGYLWQCDFGVQPSSVAEVQGISNLEYMKQGKPIITTSNGAQKEYVNHMKNGLLVKPNNVEQLAEALRTLCQDPDLRERLGKQAKLDFDKNLNYNTFYNKITTLYSNLLAD